jgi:hypothetical protein
VRIANKLAILVAVLLLCVLSGCGDFFVSEDSLETITVSPTGALTSVGQTVKFTATATTVGGQTSDVTSSATWSSSSASVATVSAGVATAVTNGTTTISASQGSVSGNASLRVTATKLQSIAIEPSNPTLFQTQGTQQFKATGTFEDGSTLDLTGLVQWSSSSSSVATINKSGLATLVAAGSASITASITSSGGTVTSSTSLTVN